MGDDWRRTSGAVGCARTVPVLLLFPEHEFVHDPHGLGPLPARAPAALEPSAVPKPAAGAPVSSVAEVEGLCAPPRPVYHDRESSARDKSWQRLRLFHAWRLSDLRFCLRSSPYPAPTCCGRLRAAPRAAHARFGRSSCRSRNPTRTTTALVTTALVMTAKSSRFHRWRPPPARPTIQECRNCAAP